MADYKYLKENNLYEAHMRFMRAIGESFGYSPIEEDDNDENQQNPQDNGGAPMDAGMPQGGAPDGGAQDPMGGMPPPPGPNDAPQEPNMGEGMPDAQGGDGNMPPMPQDDPSMGGEMPPTGMDEEEPKEEDDVIDVDDLTNAQEKTNDKVNTVEKELGKVDTRINKLLGAIETLQGMFDRNNQEIEDLKNEFEKRNPTQTEKLNIRSLNSYPYGIQLDDYWKDKTKNSNYSVYSDNDEPTTQEFVITNNDVDNFNERDIADSFTIDDDLEQDIKKIFNLS